MAGVPAVGLEELHDVADPVLETACVVQELADRDPFCEGRGITVEVEQALRNELKDERGDEDLRHAPDAEAVIDRDYLARSRSANPDAASTCPSGPTATATAPGTPVATTESS